MPEAAVCPALSVGCGRYEPAKRPGQRSGRCVGRKVGLRTVRAASAVCSGRGHALRSKRRACRFAARNAAFDQDAVRFRPQQTREAGPDEPLDVRILVQRGGKSSSSRRSCPRSSPLSAPIVKATLRRLQCRTSCSQSACGVRQLWSAPPPSYACQRPDEESAACAMQPVHRQWSSVPFRQTRP